MFKSLLQKKNDKKQRKQLLLRWAPTKPGGYLWQQTFEHLRQFGFTKGEIHAFRFNRPVGLNKVE